MTVRTLTCYVLDCDTCGQQIESVEYEGATNPIHCDSPEAARLALVGDPDEEGTGNRYLDGQHIDGVDLCGECATKRACGMRGHRWSDWSPCYCRGLNNERPPREGHEGGCPQWRYCERQHCNAREERQAVAA